MLIYSQVIVLINHFA